MRTLVIALLLAVCGAAWAAPMTNDDVIKMVKGGLGDATVLQAIDAAEAGFDTSPDGLVKLKQGGVSEAVIQRILARASAKPAAQPAAQPASQPMAAPVACPQCGTITGIREIDKPGQGTGVGAVAGGVIGGVLGRSIGGRDNRTAGTVVGAVGGAVAGHHIEKHARSGKTWELNVRFDDGSSRSFHQDMHPSWNTGQRVRLVNGALTPL
jgi:outer membrane lipoprotein SlyB